jgi:alpha-L-rhamnosidase
MDNPLGIDVATPHLSWQSNIAERNWRQSAYRILVASTPELLSSGRADIWDSGKQSSAESVGIAYGGPALASGRRYYWTVQVWDAGGRMTQPSAPAWWEMGLLSPSDWKAQWISRKDADEEPDRAGIRWLWVEGQDAFSAKPSTVAVFRLDVNVADKPRNAAFYLLSRAVAKVKVNGHHAGAKDGRYLAFDRQDITEFLVTGSNTIEVTLTTVAAGGFGGPRQTGPRATGFAGLLKITRADGTVERRFTDERWQARLATESEWKPAAVVASLGDKRMGAEPGTLPGPASLVRREFVISKSVKSVRLYVTALGSYRAFLNGKRVGDYFLTPEYTEYAKRVSYQTYDVTPLIGRGPNAFGAMLGDGWFASAMSWTGVRFSFLPPPTRLLAQLRIDYADGTADTVITDGSWKTAPAPILHSEIYAGEVYDARLEQPDWNKPGFDDSRWSPSTVSDAPPGVLSGQATVPVRIVESITPKAITPAADGRYIVDMGQNMVGWVKFKVAGPAGTKVRLRFAEILNPDGTLYVENLRNANQTDAYYLRGGGEEIFEPYFTFHGFRYVEVTGYPGTLTVDRLSGQVASSAHTITGKLTTSSDLVNRMWRTGIWGQRGNFLSVPTDCPQRDERLGWTGDAQVFWRTGAYNADIAAFGRKWLLDVVDGQTEQGAFGNTAPNLPGGGFGPGAPGWGDAGVIVPWTAWQHYGDKRLIRENWPAMQKWMKFIEDANPDFLRRKKTGANFADWLPAGSQTPRDLVATAYWAMIARMMAHMATALDLPADAARYSTTYENIRSAFQKAFIKPDGQIGSGSQTSYLLALHMKLVPEALKHVALDNLVKDIEAHNGHLTTGFLGTPHLLFVLADNNRTDVAYRLLLNDTYPSWGYMLSKGATTWWERWNSDTGDPSMNSFNHYAFGSVMAWVYRYVAGIDTAPETPGFRKIIVRPRLDERMNHARGEYDSVYGKIVTDWTGAPKGPFSLKLTVPANTTAIVYLPAIPNARVTEGGRPMEAKAESDAYVLEVGSGTYNFEVR